MAKPSAGAPTNYPPAPTRGSRAVGLRYERAFAGALEALYPGTSDHNPWFYFEDANGPGYCQPDLLLAYGQDLFVIEAKLTDCEAGRLQLRELYLPVLRHVLGNRVFGLTVSRNLTVNTPEKLICESVDIAILSARNHQIPVLHWRGGTLQ